MATFGVAEIFFSFFFLGGPGSFVDYRADLPNDLLFGPVDRFVAALDGLLQVGGQRLVVLFQVRDGPVHGTPEGVADVLPLVVGFPEFAPQTNRLIDCGGDLCHFAFKSLNLGIVVFCPGFFNLPKKLMSRLSVLLDGLAVGNEAGITQRNPLGDLKTFVGVIGVQDRVAAIDGKPADRYDKIVITLLPKNIRILENGGEMMSIAQWLVSYGGCKNYPEAYNKLRNEESGVINTTYVIEEEKPIKYISQEILNHFLCT